MESKRTIHVGEWSDLSRLEMETRPQRNESRVSRTHGSSCTASGIEGTVYTYNDLHKNEASGHHRKVG